jgi:4-aminobutyrate aminotransferase
MYISSHINLGHCHSLVTEAAQEACATLVHAQMNIMRHEPMMNVINNLTRTHLAQKSRIDNWFLWNGGSDAVEGALKIA